MANVNIVREYLEEEVNYGGIPMTRGQMICELTATAKATGREDWQVLVNAYLAGHARKNGWHGGTVHESRRAAARAIRNAPNGQA
jgi:hypothetical protein